jgi:adenylate kinase family enzyme
MIINIVGPCGAGKTTLTQVLSQSLSMPMYSIADFRARYGSEIEAWSAMKERVDKSENCIIDSTGLNLHLYEIVLKGKDKITIKLQCSLKEALRRSRPDEGTSEFGISFNEFVRKSILYAQRLEADLVIDTEDFTEEEVLDKALSFIQEYTKNLANSRKKGIKRGTIRIEAFRSELRHHAGLQRERV